jgi:hypothetical protein
MNTLQDIYFTGGYEYKNTLDTKDNLLGMIKHSGMMEHIVTVFGCELTRNDFSVFKVEHNATDEHSDCDTIITLLGSPLSNLKEHINLYYNRINLAFLGEKNELNELQIGGLDNKFFTNYTKDDFIKNTLNVCKKILKEVLDTLYIKWLNTNDGMKVDFYITDYKLIPNTNILILKYKVHNQNPFFNIIFNEDNIKTHTDTITVYVELKD